MANITYPPKPWKDGQVQTLMNGLDFAYSSSLRKWVPITPSTTKTQTLVEAFGVSTVQEFQEKQEKIDEEITVISEEITKTKTEINRLDSDIELSGRIWKTDSSPTKAKDNDVWIQRTTGKMLAYNASAGTWVEILYTK